MGDALPQRLDLPLLLGQPPLQPLNLLAGHRELERASQPRPQPGLAPGEVVVLTLTISLGLVTIDLRLVTIGSRLVTIGLGLRLTNSSGQPLVSVTSPGEPHHGSPEPLELVVIRVAGVTGARARGFITHSLDQSSIIITGLKYLTHLMLTNDPRNEI